HDTVEANVLSEFKVEEHRITHLDRVSEMRANDHLTVGVTQHVKVGTGQFVEAGSEIHYHAGDKVVIEGGMELTAKAGGSFVKVDAGGVTISGAEVKANTGGAPGVGSGVAILAPLIPLPASSDKSGNLLARKEVLEAIEYDMDFIITDQNSGLPLRNFPYVIKTTSGQNLVGRTDEHGKTRKISSLEAETATIEVYDDVPPLNPHWDA
ncbi:type VI secretion system tip protein VgrG, partial [Pseudomonas sp. 22082]